LRHQEWKNKKSFKEQKHSTIPLSWSQEKNRRYFSTFEKSPFDKEKKYIC